MKNEVYGSIELNVSVSVDSNNRNLGILEANYKINSDRFYKKCSLLLEDLKGNIHTVRVNNINDVSWEKFFGKDE